MRVRNQTTVVLTKKAQEIKEDLAPVFGLKNILSAGLLLLGKLSAEQKQKAIADANKIAEPSEEKPPIANVSESIETLKHFIRYKVPSADEERELESLRQLLGPQPKKQKRKAKGG